MAEAPLNLTPEHLRALARRSFSFFCRGAMQTLLPTTRINWHPCLDLIGSRLQDAAEGRCRRLIINIPPRHGKSLIGSVALPAFVLGHNPHAELICASYSGDLARKMARDTKKLMESSFYRQRFDTRLASNRESLGELKTQQGGSRLATSIDGTLTGRGGNMIIIDDPLKPDEAHSVPCRTAVNDWFDRTVVSRPNNKETDAIVLIMQRLHEDDLVGHLMRKGEWELLSLQAIAEEEEEWTYESPLGSRIWRRSPDEILHPGRETRETLAQLRADMSAYDFAAQYQQRPAPAGGGEIRAEWFRTYDPQQPPQFIRRIQSWDTAASDSSRADWSVCVTIGETRDHHYYLIDCFRGRLLYPELKRKARELAELHDVGQVVIEKSSSGDALIEELKREGFFRVHPVTPKGTKYERIIARTGLIEAGKVWLPQHSHWVPAFLHEAVMFPSGAHDDQVDALAQGLAWLVSSSGPAQWLWAMEEADRLREQQRGGQQG